MTSRSVWCYFELNFSSTTEGVENGCYCKPVLLAAVAASTDDFWKYFALWNFLFKKLAQDVYKPPARDPPLFVNMVLLEVLRICCGNH